MNISRLIKNLIQIIVIGAILVVTKRKMKWIFWPFFVGLSLLLSPWLVFLIIIIVEFVIGFITGMNIEINNYDWVVFPIWAIVFVIITPLIYRSITLIEEELDGKPTDISIWGKVLGFLWGVLVNIFLLYRLDFFQNFY